MTAAEHKEMQDYGRKEGKEEEGREHKWSCGVQISGDTMEVTKIFCRISKEIIKKREQRQREISEKAGSNFMEN